MATKKKSYKEFSKEELESELKTVEMEYQKSRFDKVVGDARKSHEIKTSRKNISRIKTFLRQKELEQNK